MAVSLFHLVVALNCTIDFMTASEWHISSNLCYDVLDKAMQVRASFPKKISEARHKKMLRTKNKKQLRKDERGLTIIEALVGIFLIGLVMSSLYMILTQTVAIMADSKQRTGAMALAMEVVEQYRNVSYENIPVISPAVVENVQRNGLTYSVETSVVLLDDPENGTDPEGDYKRVGVKVAWVNREQERSVYFTNNFAPTGIAHGIILVNVYDGDTHSTLGDALVELEEFDGEDEYSQLTDGENGNALFFGLDEDSKEYQVTISKTGYGTLQTFEASSTSLLFDPIYKNVVLVDGNDSALRYFPLRQTSNLTVHAVDESGNDLSGVEIELFGGQKIGNDPDAYSYDDTGNHQTTDSEGEVSYEDEDNPDSKMNPGNYELANIGSLEKSGYEFIGVKDGRYPFSLDAGTSDVLELVFVDALKNSLRVRVTDASDGALVREASVRLFKTDLSYDETVTTDSLGLAFFRFDEDGLFEELIAGDYQMEISADGYVSATDTVTIDEFSSKEVVLTLVE